MSAITDETWQRAIAELNRRYAHEWTRETRRGLLPCAFDDEPIRDTLTELFERRRDEQAAN